MHQEKNRVKNIFYIFHTTLRFSQIQQFCFLVLNKFTTIFSFLVKIVIFFLSFAMVCVNCEALRLRSYFLFLYHIFEVYFYEEKRKKKTKKNIFETLIQNYFFKISNQQHCKITNSSHFK